MKSSVDPELPTSCHARVSRGRFEEGRKVVLGNWRSNPGLRSAWPLVAAVWVFAAFVSRGADPFQLGMQSYLSGNFQQAADSFRAAAEAQPAGGTLHNLGNAEWKCGRPGPAILAWEKAYWVDPFNANTRANLRYARKSSQLESPDLAWFEICSAWLPVNFWAWIAGGSLWLALSMVLLPGIFRWRKYDWHQGVAAAGFALFLLTLPALLGVQTRTKLGVLLTKQAPLRLTPTKDAQVLGHLPAGDVVRQERERGEYVYIRAGNDAAGWIGKNEFGLICAR
jgi:hypothetical protein